MNLTSLLIQSALHRVCYPEAPEHNGYELRLNLSTSFTGFPDLVKVNNYS